MPEVIEPSTPPSADSSSDQSPEPPKPAQTPPTDLGQAPADASPSNAWTPPPMDETPTVSGPVVGFNSAANPTPTSSFASSASDPAPALTPSPTVFGQAPPTSKSPKKRLAIIVSVVVAVLLLAGGYVFAFYLPNTPSHIYSASLVNSGKAADQLIHYAEQQQQVHYKGASLTGSLNVKTGSSSFTANVSSASDGMNTTATAAVNFLGNNVTANVRSIHIANSTFPDSYLQFKTNPALLNQAGLGSLSNLNGKWIEISHTYFENLTKDLGSEDNPALSMSLHQKIPTTAEVDDAINKVQTVNKQYIFTTNTSTAVLANEKYLGKTTLNGHAQDHYAVGYNKTHLGNYLVAVGKALDNSKLNSWSHATFSNRDLSQVVDLTQSGVSQELKKADSNYTFDLWADPKTKLVSKLSFTDPTEKTFTFYLGQNYTGGSSYPFYLGFRDTKSGGAGNANLGFTLDTITHKAIFNLSGGDSSTTVSGNFTLTPSNNAVHVTAPTGAEPFQDVLNSLGLGSLLPTTGTGKTTLPTSPLPGENPGGPCVGVGGGSCSSGSGA